MIFFTKLKLTELKVTNKGSTSFQVNNENYFGKTTMPKYVGMLQPVMWIRIHIMGDLLDLEPHVHTNGL